MSSIKDKITPGEWESTGYHIRSDKRFAPIGQSYVADVPRHENKFAVDTEGIANAKLWASSKSMLDILERLDKWGKNEHRNDTFWEIVDEATNLLKQLNNE